MEEIWQAIDVLIQQGKILYAGSSQLRRLAHRPGQGDRRPPALVGLVSEQCIYNLLDRGVEMEVIPAAQEYGLGVIPWSPLHGGLLGGVLSKEREGGAPRRPAGPRTRSRQHRDADPGVRGLLPRSSARSPATSALAWLLHRPGVTGPIVGPRTSSSWTAPCAPLELELDADALQRLDGFSRAPDRAGGLRLVTDTRGWHPRRVGQPPAAKRTRRGMFPCPEWLFDTKHD